MNKHFVSLVAVAVFLWSMLLPAIAAPEPLFDNMNPDLVYNNPPSAKVQIANADSRPIRVSQIYTYHWNDGCGAQPGTISIWENGKKLGEWQAEGRGGSGVDNIYWIVYPQITLYPGHSYEIHDSDVATWSWNEASGNCGMFELQGAYQAKAPKAKKNNAKPKAQSAVSSKGWKLVYCKTTREGDDPRVNVFRHTENDGYVRYHIEESQDELFTAVYETSCTMPPSSVSPGQKVVLELKINMNAKLCDKEHSTYGIGRNLNCCWDPGKNVGPSIKKAGDLESVKPNGRNSANVFKCNDGRARNIGQDKVQVFYRFPKEKHGGISIYCHSHDAFGTMMTEFRYE